jgi:hypothetical protein
MNLRKLFVNFKSQFEREKKSFCKPTIFKQTDINIQIVLCDEIFLEKHTPIPHTT